MIPKGYEKMQPGIIKVGDWLVGDGWADFARELVGANTTNGWYSHIKIYRNSNAGKCPHCGKEV